MRWMGFGLVLILNGLEPRDLTGTKLRMQPWIHCTRLENFLAKAP